MVNFSDYVTNDTFSTSELLEMYDEMIDSCYEPIDIMGCVYDMSSVLKDVDPIRYALGLTEFEDDLEQQKREEEDDE